MQFVELQDEVIQARFREGQRDSVKRWINKRYTFVNGVADWPWRWPARSTLTTLADGTVALPADAVHVEQVFSAARDYELPFMDWREFQTTYLGSDQTADDPLHYTLDRSGFLHVAPAAAADLVVNYTGRPSELVANTDEPVWPEHWHFTLVLGATSTGLKLENDPTWTALETEFLADVELMKDELLPPHQPEPRQFGRQPYDAWL
jgi:hypothetical protein